MAEYSRHQKKIIDRYYDNRDDIMLRKLQELVTELYLADAKKRPVLWERVEKALVNLKVRQSVMTHIVESKDEALLARHIQDWLKAGGPPRDKK